MVVGRGSSARRAFRTLIDMDAVEGLREEIRSFVLFALMEAASEKLYTCIP